MKLAGMIQAFLQKMKKGMTQIALHHEAVIYGAAALKTYQCIFRKRLASSIVKWNVTDQLCSDSALSHRLVCSYSKCP